MVVVYRMRAADPTRRVAIATFTPRSGVASYMHSFGLTDQFAVFIEQPIVFDMNAMVLGKSMIEGMPVDYTKPTFFHVVPLDGGPIVTKQAPFSFTFNHVSNTFEANGSLIIDIFEVFRDAHLMVGGAFNIWLNKTRRDAEINFEAMRFTIPFDSSPVVARGLLGRDVTYSCTGHTCDQLRLPRIHPTHQGRPYCYAYAMQTKWKGGPFACQSIVKVDVCHGSVEDLGVRYPGQYPHEVLFVPRPGAAAEDDGVLVGHLLDGPANTSYIQIIDAQTRQQIANASLPLRLGEMIHGNWLA